MGVLAQLESSVSIEDQRLAVVAEARSWYCTPFHDNQLCKGAGTDCLGLIVGAYRNVGLISSVDIPYYSAQHHFHEREEIYLNNVLRHFGEVERPGMGDIAIFQFGHTYSHAGIVVKWPTEMIHSYVGVGVSLVDPTRHAQLRKRYSEAFFFSPWEQAGRIATDMLRRRLDQEDQR